jgi:hypothetical protein
MSFITIRFINWFMFEYKIDLDIEHMAFKFNVSLYFILFDSYYLTKTILQGNLILNVCFLTILFLI